MIITICSSIKFWPQIVEVKKQLEDLGYKVLTPPHEVPNKEGDMIPVEEYYRLRKEMIELQFVNDTILSTEVQRAY